MSPLVDIHLPKTSADFIVGRKQRLYIALDDLTDILEAHRAIYQAAGFPEGVEVLRAEIDFLNKAREGR